MSKATDDQDPRKSKCQGENKEQIWSGTLYRWRLTPNDTHGTETKSKPKPRPNELSRQAGKVDQLASAAMAGTHTGIIKHHRLGFSVW